MLVRKLLKLLITVSLVASACQPATDNSGLAPNQIAPQQAQNQMVEVDHSISHRLPTHSPHLKGQISTVNNNDQVNFKINIIPNATQGFSTQALDKTQIRYVKMYVTGIGITGKIWNDNGFIDTTDLNASVQISGIPPGSNRVLTAIAYDVNKVEIPGAQVKGYYSSTASGNIQVEVTWKFVPVANALEKLIENNDLNTLRSFDVNVFQEAIEELIYGSNDRNGTAFLVHPTLLDFEALTKAIQDNPQLNTQGLLDVLKNSQNFLIQPQTLKGILVGLVAGETLEVTSNDPATNTVIKLVATGDNDVFAFNDASPGNWVFTVNNLTRDEVLTTKTAPGGSTIKFMTYDEVVQALIESRDPALVEAAELALQNAQNAQTQAQNALLDAQNDETRLVNQVTSTLQEFNRVKALHDQALSEFNAAQVIKNAAQTSYDQLLQEADPTRVTQAEADLKAAENAVKDAENSLTQLIQEMKVLHQKYFNIYNGRVIQFPSGGDGFNIKTIGDGSFFRKPPAAIVPPSEASITEQANAWKTNLQTLYNFAEERVESMEDKVDDLENAYNSANQKLEELEEKIADLEEQLNNVRKYSRDWRSLKSEIWKTKFKLGGAKTFRNIAKKLWDDSKNYLEAEEAILTDFNTEYEVLVQKVDAALESLNSARNDLDNAVQTLLSVQQSVQAAKDALPEAEQALNSAIAALTLKQDALNVLITEVSDAQRIYNQATAAHILSQSAVTTAQTQLTAAQTVVAEAQRELELIPFRSAHLEKVKATLEELLNQNRREEL